MANFFRVSKGLEIDNGIRFVHTAGIPGDTVDTGTANVGSVGINTITGELYSKRIAGTGVDKWTLVSTTNTFLYGEKLGLVSSAPSPLASNSIALGSGAQTAVGATGSLAIGDQSLSRLPGSIVHANGRFAISGDAQVGQYILRGHTVNDTETELFLDGTNGSQRLILTDDTTWTFKITVTAHRTDQSDGHAGYTIEGVVYRINGVNTISLVGNGIKSILAETNSNWDVNVTADQINGSLKIACIGEIGKIIRWVARVDTVEVTN